MGITGLTVADGSAEGRGLDGSRTPPGRLGGEFSPGAAAYDVARRLWNGMVDKRPAAIARCATAEDVREALAFARQAGLTVAVRGGGHSIAGASSCEGGLMIDLSPMQGIRVDPRRRTARAEPGVLIGEFDAATQAHGLATTMGVNSDTGIAGLTLGGGLGRLGRSVGLTCDNLLVAEVMLADGRVVRATEEENPDLFWGLRGGGGNFGVATAFEYRLHPLGPTVLGGMLLWTGRRPGRDAALRCVLRRRHGRVDALGVLLGPGRRADVRRLRVLRGIGRARRTRPRPLREGGPGRRATRSGRRLHRAAGLGGRALPRGTASTPGSPISCRASATRRSTRCWAFSARARRHVAYWHCSRRRRYRAASRRRRPPPRHRDAAFDRLPIAIGRTRRGRDEHRVVARRVEAMRPSLPAST